MSSPAAPAQAGAIPNPLTTAPIPPTLLRLALPVLASQVLRIAYQWVDALWVSGLGVAATAAVTSSVFVMWWVFSLVDVVALGVVAYVSQLIGADDRARAGVAAWKALRATVLVGLPAVAAGLFAAERIFGLLGATPAVAAAGRDYLGIILVFAPLPMVAITCEGIMRGAGDTRTPLLIDLCAVGLNAVLDPFLIFGWGPFPRLGVAGAAWATGIAQAVMVGAYLACAARGHRAFPLRRTAPGEPVRIAGLLRVGVPAAIIGILFSIVYMVFARIAAGFGPGAMAVVGIVNRIEAISYMTAVSLGSAAAVLVGQNLGAGHPDRAERAVKVGVAWGASFSAVLTAVLILWPEAFLSLFTRDPAALAVGVPYQRVVALCLTLNAVEIVAAEGVIGSGHTAAISVIFTSFSLLRIPMSLALAAWTPLGPMAVAWTITLTCSARSLVIWWWFRQGKWKTGLGREIRPAETVEIAPAEAT